MTLRNLLNILTQNPTKNTMRRLAGLDLFMEVYGSVYLITQVKYDEKLNCIILSDRKILS